MFNSKRPKIGLALGSGGARGLAHIGILKVLEENNIPIDFISGSSIGAIVGGFYASGLSVEKMEKIALETNWRKIFSTLVEPSLKKGFIGGEKIKEFIENHVGGKKIEDCEIKFSAIATNLKTAETVIFDKGDMASAIRASISIPLVFKPVEIDNKILIDGGLSSPVPTETIKKMGADIIIAVNLNKHYYDEQWKPGWYDILNDSLGILQYHLASLDAANADLVIEIDTGKTPWYQFTKAREKISIGEKTARESLPKLKEIINQKSKKSLKKYLMNLFGCQS